MVEYPQCTIYVLDLGIKCNTPMLNFNRAEYVGEGGGSSLASANQLIRVKQTVGLWVRGPTETFPFGLLGLCLRQLKVDMPLSTTLVSDFVNSTVSTSL